MDSIPLEFTKTCTYYDTSDYISIHLQRTMNNVVGKFNDMLKGNVMTFTILRSKMHSLKVDSIIELTIHKKKRK